MSGKKKWQRWIVVQQTYLHQVEAHTVEEARAMFDANESVCIDQVDKWEQSEVVEVDRNP
jgi:hypothetical protein